MPTTTSSTLPTGLRPLLAESLWGTEAAALAMSPVWDGAGVPRGNGLGVLVIPGLLAGDVSVSTLSTWLRARGYHPAASGIRMNADCLRKAHRRLESRLEDLVAATGRPAVLIGQSRGGLMAKLLAVLRPDLVQGLVTLGTPLTDVFAVHPAVRRHIDRLAALGDRGAPGLFDRSCLPGGACWDEVMADLGRPFPPTVAFTSVYSRRDGIVDWRACLDPEAEHLEVRATHCGMAVHPEVYGALAVRLGALAAQPGWRRAA